MSKPPPNRRILGFALLASALILLVCAILISARVVSLSDRSRSPVLIVLAGAAVLDAALGVYFLSAATE